ncbi:hypothetical protein CCMSSC00406_0009994 [Pleurotus cornucopiae]|uniref:Uncharacterized protein n=1 Tax=Pleurotus cornucopiae TaxID=5321 RepID=A0ACB7J8W3_PLECO|nr:hypothetical protein CCMSSC00406_0009994 [Pleurotus cornucopiae]
MRDYVNPDFVHDNESQRAVSLSLAIIKLPLVCMIAIAGLFLSCWKIHLIDTNNELQYLRMLADNGSAELDAAMTKTSPEALEKLVQFLGMGDMLLLIIRIFVAQATAFVFIVKYMSRTTLVPLLPLSRYPIFTTSPSRIIGSDLFVLAPGPDGARQSPGVQVTSLCGLSPPDGR